MLNKYLVGLLFLGAVAGCDDNEVDMRDSKIVQLEAERKVLTAGLKNATAMLRDLEESGGVLVNQEIIVEPAIFTDESETLQAVKDRKVLHCGGNADLPGFGYLDPDSSQFVGFDIDLCRAIAAAVLGPEGADQIEIVPLTSKLRFAALQTGDIDVLTRNTTWTMSRDSELRADYAGITFYDGQGVLVRDEDEIRKLSDFQMRTICVQSGSTSSANVLAYFADQGLSVEVREFDDRIAALKQYEQRGCDGYTGDKSSLISQRTLLEDPKEHRILIDQISREPLGPVVRHNDDVWKDVVTWTIQCMLNGEQLGVSADTVKDDLDSDKVAIQRLLGVAGDLGEKLGLQNDFCFQTISQVGNYKDIYERHLGPETDFNLARGLNALDVDGGIHYPLPFQ
jgi:general L-amino acid transport system substrate-binding protein